MGPVGFTFKALGMIFRAIRWVFYKKKGVKTKKDGSKDKRYKNTDENEEQYLNILNNWILMEGFGSIAGGGGDIHININSNELKDTI